MNCTVNGEARELPEGTTIEQLLALLEMSDAVCAVEVDKQLVPNRERADRVLADGQRVEIVTLIGGG
jgi:sulfur carrier protein